MPPEGRYSETGGPNPPTLCAYTVLSCTKIHLRRHFLPRRYRVHSMARSPSSSLSTATTTVWYSTRVYTTTNYRVWMPCLRPFCVARKSPQGQRTSRSFPSFMAFLLAFFLACLPPPRFRRKGIHSQTYSTYRGMVSTVKRLESDRVILCRDHSLLWSKQMELHLVYTWSTRLYCTRGWAVWIQGILYVVWTSSHRKHVANNGADRVCSEAPSDTMILQ